MRKELPYRKAVFAGSWYAEDPIALRKEIDSYLKSCRSSTDKQTAKIGMLPHAGLYYSGRGIAGFFNRISNEVNRVCIISPSHYSYLTADRITTADFSYLETPLLELPYEPLCEKFPDAMKECNSKVLKEEHALEMVLPFIARASEDFGHEISVSMGLISHFSDAHYVNDLSDKMIEALGRDEILAGRTVIIASSDFTHYGERFGYTPYGVDDISHMLNSVASNDRSYAEGFVNGSIEELMVRCIEEKPTICGFAPGLLASAIACKLSLHGIVADYYSSNDLTKNPLAEFVSYCTIIWE